MSRKFIIVKPTLCCRNSIGVGKIFESGNFVLSSVSICFHCNAINSAKNDIPYYYEGKEYAIEESRIKWLPDLNEQDELNQIKELEKETL
jgi:hypothetical protein